MSPVGERSGGFDMARKVPVGGGYGRMNCHTSARRYAPLTVTYTTAPIRTIRFMCFLVGNGGYSRVLGYRGYGASNSVASSLNIYIISYLTIKSSLWV